MDCSGLSLANYSVPQGGPRLKFVWSARDITLSTTNPFAAKTFSRFSTFSWGYWCRGCSNFSGWWRSFFQFIQICTSKTNITPSYQIFHHTNIYVHAYIYIDIIIYIYIYVYVYIYIYLWRLLKREVPPVIIQVMDHDLVKQPTVDLWCRSWSWPQLGQEWRFFLETTGGYDLVKQQISFTVSYFL